jgi:hypothetical protein
MSAAGLFGITYGCRFNIDSSGNAYLALDDLTSGNTVASSGIDLFDNVWHNVVATENGITGNIHIDTSLNTGSNAMLWYGTTRWPTNGASIGRDQNDVVYFLSGSVAVARIYNRVLSQAEITQNYDALKGRFGL